MITVNRNTEQKIIFVKSTDSKPTVGIANGTFLLEINSGDVYVFDEEGGSWIKL